MLALFLMLLCHTSSAEQSQSATYKVLNVNDVQQRVEVKNLVVVGGGDLLQQKVNIRDLNRLATDKIAQYSNPVSVDELHIIADALTVYVRNQGFSFHTVYLPPQQIHKNTVTFRYAESYLSGINVINQSKVKDKSIEKPLRELVGKELYAPDIEEKIYLLKRHNNIKIFPFYSRGNRSGEVKLNIRVTDNPVTMLSLKAENYGSDTSGKHRAIANFRFKSVMNDFDEINLSLLHSADTEKTLHGFIRYSRPFENLKSALSFSYGDSQFDIGKEFETLEMSGNSQSFNAEFSRILSSDPQGFRQLHINYFNKNSTVISQFSETLDNEEESSGFSAGIFSKSQFDSLSMSVGGDFISGRFSETRNASEEIDFSKVSYFLNASLALGTASRFAVSPNINIRGQYTDQALPGVESSSLSGYYSVRAFSAGQFSSDSASVVSFNLYAMNLLKNKWFQALPYLFYDYATGVSYYPDEDLTTNLQGIGLGMSLRYKQISTVVTYAQPGSSKSSNMDIDGEPQWLLELRWR